MRTVYQNLTLLAEQGTTEGFFNNLENADKLGGLMEDIRDAMMEYQVCVPDHSFLRRLMFAPDFVATRYLRQELSVHRESHPLAFQPHELTDE